MTEALIKRLENTLTALRNNLKKFQDKERCLQESKEVMLKEKMLLEADVANSVSTARNQLSAHSQKVFDQTYSLLQEIYKQKLLVLELDEQTFIQKAKLERKNILKRKYQHQMLKTDDASVNALVKWWTEMQKEEENAHFNGGKYSSNRLFYNARYQDEPDADNGVEMLSFSTRYKGFCVNVQVFHNRNGCPFQSGLMYHVTSDLHVTHLKQEAVRHLTSGDSARAFVTQIIWKYLDDELFPML